MKLYLRLLPCFILAIIFSDVSAQTRVEGKVLSPKKEPVPFCTLGLLSSKDSSIVKQTLAADDGKFLMDDAPAGNYLVKVSYVGYKDFYSKPFTLDSTANIILEPFELTANAVSLDEISVAVMRKPVEFKDGNITVNIDGSPLATGNTVYDLFTKLPGVMIEGDNITVQGQGGVRVYIDDRVQPMSGAQLINFLKGINSSVIDKIEVILNPPAKYDAAGKGAIINIRTKKVKITGFSGSASYSYSKGAYYYQLPAFSLNYKGKKISFFSNISAYEGLIKNESKFDRRIATDTNVTQLTERSYEYDQGKNATIDLGADWYINKKNTVGVKMQAIPGYAMRTYPGSTNIQNSNGTSQTLRFDRSIPNVWLYTNGNVNAEHLFDTSGTVLKFSADYYGPYNDIYKGDYQNYYVDNDGNYLGQPVNFKSNNSLGITIISSKIDFEKRLSKSLSLEAGIKGNYTDAFSNYSLERQDPFSGAYTIDTAYTNDFRYKEFISAGYFSLRRELKNLSMHFGLRAENTNVEAGTVTKTVSYTWQYFKVFPVFSMNYNGLKNNSFSFSGNTRIERPDYNSFNPYKQFNNLLVSNVGNPYLLPSYGYNFLFNHVYKGSISNTLIFSHHVNPVLNVSYQDDATLQTLNQSKNMNYMNHIRYVLYGRVEIKKWWVASGSFGAYYITFVGKLNNSDFSNTKIPWWINSNNQFLLKKNWKIEYSIFYWSPWLGGIGTMQERWGMDLAVKKSFSDNKWTASVSINDPFYTKPFRNYVNYGNQYTQSFSGQDTRRVAVSLGYNFGKVKVEQRQLDAAEEEKGRLSK